MIFLHPVPGLEDETLQDIRICLKHCAETLKMVLNILDLLLIIKIEVCE